MAVNCPHCEGDTITLTAKFWSSYWRPVRCPKCDGLSVPDAKKGFRYAFVAILPLLVIALIVLSFPFEELLAADWRWAYVFPALSVLNLIYLGGVILMLNAKVPLTSYQLTHRVIAKRFTGVVLLTAIIASITWLVLW